MFMISNESVRKVLCSKVMNEYLLNSRHKMTSKINEFKVNQ